MNKFNMELRYLMFFLFFGLFACKSGTNEDTSKIGQLKKVLADAPTKENRDALIAEYQTLIKANPNDGATNTAYFAEIADLHIENKSNVLGIQTLIQGIQDYPSIKGASNLVWKLAENYDSNIKRPAVGGIIKKIIRTIISKRDTCRHS